ncbi:hypothetical protein [Flavobacterium sp. FlaQc-28]|uniref:hypothetical protein n=1 Tax=Flavobacterium sp. FlaQc-28 TaxID=3374178 RepID=UPI003756AC63
MNELQKRFYVVLSIFLISIGILGIILREEIYHYLRISPYTSSIFSTTLILSGIAFFLMLYVRGGIFPFEKTVLDDANFQNDKKIFEKRFEELRSELLSIYSNSGDIRDYGEEISKRIEEKISVLSEKKIIEQITDKFNLEFYSKTKLDLIEGELLNTKVRIERETSRLSRYAYTNLMIGFITTFLAIFFLGYSLLGVESKEITSNEYFFHFLPRFSLSILVEIFSFFFLKLYKSNLEDIKYFNNEKTNIEMKIIAIKTAFVFDDKESVKQLIIELAKTERNFILKKGESTVELEKRKSDLNSNDNLLNGILKVIDRK